MNTEPLAAEAVPVSSRRSFYPPAFAARVAGRIKRRLGDHFELANFGVNLTELAPGSVSALLHHHSRQDEFIYVVAGTPTLVLDGAEFPLRPGDCCGFKAGSGIGHQLVNHSDQPARYLEIGDRTPGDVAAYPQDDLLLAKQPDGSYVAAHKDGTPY